MVKVNPTKESNTLSVKGVQSVNRMTKEKGEADTAPTDDDVWKWICKNRAGCQGKLHTTYKELVKAFWEPKSNGLNVEHAKVDAEWTIPTPNPTKGFGQGSHVYLYNISIDEAKTHDDKVFLWTVCGDTTHIQKIFGGQFKANIYRCFV